MSEQAPVVGMRVRVFNWRLRAALEAKGWTQAELARRTGVSQTTISAIVGLRQAPSEAQADAFSIALETPVDELFPGVIDGLLAERSYLDIPLDEPTVRGLAGASGLGGRFGLREAAAEAIKQLPPEERAVVALRFGLLDGEPASFEEVGRRIGHHRDQARQIEAKALRHLRHPARARLLSPYLDDDERED